MYSPALFLEHLSFLYNLIKETPINIYIYSIMRFVEILKEGVIVRRGKLKSIIALVIALSMSASLEGTLFAAESREISDDRKADAAEQMQAALNTLDGLEKGRDYDVYRAFFIAESEEEAANVADEYSSELIKYNDGVAVLGLKEEIQTVLSRALEEELSSTPIYPDLIRKIKDDVVPLADEGTEVTNDKEENTDSAVSNAKMQGQIEDPYYKYGYQWFHNSVYNGFAWDITEGEGVTVAVLDTGADLDHDDLKNRVAGSYNVLDPESDAEDTDGHGSHIAGLIAGEKGNAYGGIGIAPGAELYIIKVTEDGRICLSDEIAGINHAVEAGVDVINMSFGSKQYLSVEEDAIENALKAGVVLVASVGDASSDEAIYPAAYDGVISVASYTSYDTLSSFSNYGDHVDIAAPGGDFYTSEQKMAETQEEWKANGILSCDINNEYSWMVGTGQASAIVSASAALLLSADEEIAGLEGEERPMEVYESMIETADDIEYVYGEHIVKGGINNAELVDADADEDDDEDEEEDEDEDEEYDDAAGDFWINDSTLTAGQKVDITYLFDGAGAGEQVRYRSMDNKIARVSNKGILSPRNPGEVQINMEYNKSGEWTTVSSANLTIEMPVVEKKYEIDMKTISMNGITEIDPDIFVSGTSRKPYWIPANDFKLFWNEETRKIEVDPGAQGTVRLYAVFGSCDISDPEGTRKKYKVKIKFIW